MSVYGCTCACLEKVLRLGPQGQVLQEPYGDSPLLSPNKVSLHRQAALVNTTGESLHSASDLALN